MSEQPEQFKTVASVLRLYGYDAASFHVRGRLICGPQFNIGINAHALGKVSDLFVVGETDLETIQGHHAEAGWLAQFLAHEEGWRWLVVDLEGFALQRAGKPSRHHPYGRVFRLRDFSVGLLLAADEATLAELPAPYVQAMHRRQSGAWEPFRGLRKSKQTDAA
jgi:hypothetical protein